MATKNENENGFHFVNLVNNQIHQYEQEILDNSQVASKIVEHMFDAYSFQNPHNKPFVPCAHPRSIRRKDLSFIQSNVNEFIVGEKTDGIRAFCMIEEINNENMFVAFITRSFQLILPQNIDVSKIDEYFIVPKLSMPELASIVGTFFDGELVLDSFVWTAFDTILFQQNSMLQYPFRERFDVIKNNIQIVEEFIQLKYLTSSKKKQWFPLSKINIVWQKIKDERDIDGLIFIHLPSPLTNGIQAHMYKWKEGHTVDLYWADTLYVGDKHKIYNFVERCNASIFIDESTFPEPICTNFDGNPSLSEILEVAIIVECKISISNIDNQNVIEVTFVKERNDKPTANDWVTVSRTLETILENIRISTIVPIENQRKRKL
jgi:hypothetical protein